MFGIPYPLQKPEDKTEERAAIKQLIEQQRTRKEIEQML
jgi:hypothetical protein